MLDLDAERKTLEVKIKGKMYELTCPEWGELEAVQAKGENLAMDDVFAVLEKSGLEHEVLKGLQLPQLHTLFEAVTGVKKS